MKSYIQSTKRNVSIVSDAGTTEVPLLALNSSGFTQKSFGPRQIITVAGTLLSHAYIPFLTNYNFAGDFTIEFWVKRGGWTSTYGRLLDRRYNAGFAINRSASSDFITLSINANDTNSNTVLSQGVWTHVAVARTGSTAYLVINGVSAGGGGTTSASPTNSDNIYIGSNMTTGGGGEGTPLSMGEIRIWTTARSVAQIAANMARTIPFNSSNLIGYWPLFQGDKSDMTETNPSDIILTPAASIGEDPSFLEIFE